MVEVVNVDNSKEPQKTLNTLYKMQQDQILTDVVIMAKEDGIKVPAHRNILSARCEYFRAMFSCDMRETTQSEISLSEVNGHDLSNIIKYIYTGEIELNENNIETLMTAAHHFLLTDVVSACGKFLERKIDSSNCLGFWSIAELHGSTNLIRATQDYACLHFKDVSKSEEFLKLGDKQLRKLLASDELCVSEEETVFESIMGWLQHNKVERMKFISEMLSLVRVPFLSPSFIRDQKQLILDTMNDPELHMEIMTWYLTADMKHASKPRKGVDGTLLAIMTNSTDGTIPIHKYNFQTHEWTLCTYIEDRRNHFCAAIMNDELIIAGGFKEDHYVNTVTSVNTKTMSSKTLCPMKKCRELSSLVVLGEDLYVIGVSNYYDSTQFIERWDHRTDNWTYVPPMIENRLEQAAAALNGSLYVVGGDTNTTECYNPITNLWTMKAPMNERRSGHGITVLNNYLYVTGGDRSATVERYDLNTDTWTMKCSLNAPRSLHSCIALNNSLICLGGQRDGVTVRTEEKYDAISNVWSESPLSYEGYCTYVLIKNI